MSESERTRSLEEKCTYPSGRRRNRLGRNSMEKALCSKCGAPCMRAVSSRIHLDQLKKHR